MKRGLNAEIILNKEKEEKGIYLGADFYAEHECGIARLKTLLGVNNQTQAKHFWQKPHTLYGADARKITENTDVKHGTIKFKKHNYAYVIASDNFPMNKEDDTYIVTIMEYLNDYGAQRNISTTGVAAFWQDNAFLILFDVRKKFYKEFFTAFDNCDIMLYFSKGSNFLSNNGLTISILSKEDDEVKNELYEMDVSREELEIAVNKSKIREILKNSGKKYFALTPRWSDDAHTELKFWLNPMDQQNNNFGWYNLDELKLWVQNKGPIPIVKK